jgi:rRNA-processing protein FCF1
MSQLTYPVPQYPCARREKDLEVRSVSFDTSFLLKSYPEIDRVLKLIRKDGLSCFVTTTVMSELDLLLYNGKIDRKDYEKAVARWKRAGCKVIDFKNRFYSQKFRQECVLSMEEHHGVEPKDIRNDCMILVTALKFGVDLFLSEDFHFTSRITRDVMGEVTSAACREYSQMCSGSLYSINSGTFLKAYDGGNLDMAVVESLSESIRKPGKRVARSQARK